MRPYRSQSKSSGVLRPSQTCQNKLPVFYTMQFLGLCRIQLSLNLEEDLQGQLDLTRRGGGLCDSSRIAPDRRAGPRKQPRTRTPKVGPVEHVEELGSELHLGSFSHEHLLDQGEIELSHSRNPQGVASQLAVKTRGCSLELRRIIVFGGLSSIAQDGVLVSSRDQIGTIVGGGDSKDLPVDAAAVVITQYDGLRNARGQGHDASQLPSSQDVFGRTRHILARQIQGVVEGEIVGDVKIGVALLGRGIETILHTGGLGTLSRTPDLLGAVINGMRVGVGPLDLKAAGKTLVQRELQSMVGRICPTAALDGSLELGIEPVASEIRIVRPIRVGNE